MSAFGAVIAGKEFLSYRTDVIHNRKMEENDFL